ncbi:MAG: hypothetical protein GY861_28460 [bacterium]|nr:hypothetical protein [bacterium]
MMQRKGYELQKRHFSTKGKKTTIHNDRSYDEGMIKRVMGNIQKIADYAQLNVYSIDDAHSDLEREIEDLMHNNVNLTAEYPSGINMKKCIDSCYETVDKKMLDMATGYINLGNQELARILLNKVQGDITLKRVTSTEIIQTHDLLDRIISPTFKEAMAESRVRPEHLPPPVYN